MYKKQYEEDKSSENLNSFYEYLNGDMTAGEFVQKRQHSMVTNVAATILDFTPIGSVYEMCSGKEIITGDELTKSEIWGASVFTLVSIIPAPYIDDIIGVVKLGVIGAGKGVGKVVEKIAVKIMGKGVEIATEEGVKIAVKTGAKEIVKTGTKEVIETGAKEGGKTGGGILSDVSKGSSKIVDDVIEGGSGTVNRLEEIKVDFKYNSKYDEIEFERQLAAQEKGMNELTVQEYLENRAKYIDQGRALESNAAQQASRKEALANKIDELFDTGMSYEEAETEANKWINTQAALHNPDQIAGGNPLNVSILGDTKINSSIGSQWKYRIDSVDEHIRIMSETMTNEELKSTYLNVKLNY